MEITKKKTDTKLQIAISGRLDTTTASQLEAELKVSLPGITELEIDMANLDYISSAGLRVLLASQKKMSGKKMLILGACPAVKEVFDITGFSDIFTFA